MRLAALAALAVAGCGPAVPVYKVTGKVTYQGKPLTTGVVAFHHKDGVSPMAKGDVRPDGTYELSTFQPGDGAAAGACTVTVSSVIPGQGMEGEPGFVAPKALIPIKYMRLLETPLTATVEPKDNVVNFSLTP
jgi:hypothetical protein